MSVLSNSVEKNTATSDTKPLKASSWDLYITQLCEMKDNIQIIEHGAILSSDDGKLYSASEVIKELDKDDSSWRSIIVKTLREGFDVTLVRNDNMIPTLQLLGKEYVLARGDDRSLYFTMKTAAPLFSTIGPGLICVKTKRTILVGLYPDNIQPGQAAIAIEQLADYLILKNF